MEELVYYNELYDYYKELLTEKQKNYFEEYYFNNLSLSEIAENYDITRNAVSKQLKIVIEKLDELEEKLSLRKKSIIMEEIMEDIDDKKIVQRMREVI